jgi:large subunit ribosomal protein L17
LAKPRLGDAGPRAILEFVGVRDRIVERSEKPAFEDDAPESDTPESETVASEEASEESAEKKEAE